MTKTVSDREPIELVEKHTKSEERKLTMQRKSTMPKICGWKDFVKIKRARTSKQSSLDMVARNKSNHISVVDTSRFAHKTTARCALNVNEMFQNQKRERYILYRAKSYKSVQPANQLSIEDN